MLFLRWRNYAPIEKQSLKDISFVFSVWWCQQQPNVLSKTSTFNFPFLFLHVLGFELYSGSSSRNSSKFPPCWQKWYFLLFSSVLCKRRGGLGRVGKCFSAILFLGGAHRYLLLDFLSPCPTTFSNYVCMYRGRPLWKCPWGWGFQPDLGEGSIGVVGPMFQPRGTINTVSRMLVHTGPARDIATPLKSLY